jgi:hypothetical protein
LIAGDDLRSPVIIPHGPKLWVSTLGKNSTITPLHATETIFAEGIGCVEHLPLIIPSLTINRIDAKLFHAVGAIQTPVPFDNPKRTGRNEAWGYRFRT